MTVVSEEIQKRVTAKLDECMLKIERATERGFKFPNVTYTKRGRTAGTAQHSTYTINLNPIILNENTDAFIERTVPHEFAHLVDYILNPETRNRRGRFGRRKKSTVHGKTWKNIMMLFGAPITRTHSYDTSSVPRVNRIKNKFKYRCGGCDSDLFLGPVRHKRIQSGRKYWCCDRTDPLVFIEPVGQVTVREGHDGVNKFNEKKSPSKKRAQGPSKIDRAMMIFKIYHTLKIVNEKREDIIGCFMSELDMSKSGATTYFYTCRKKLL
jgi:SprT protein